MPRFPILFLTTLAAAAFVAVPDAAAAQAAADSNFKRCLAADPYCEMRKLSSPQRQRVFEQARRNHLDSCLAGRMCNLAALAPPEQARVRAAVAQLNYRACLAGDAACDPAQLSDAQRAEAALRERARNLERCLAGLTGCDESLLEPAQLHQVRERASERNYALCLQGAFVDCRLEDLSQAQRVRVEQRRREANLFLCTYSLVGCVPDLLTAEERAQVAATRPALLR